MVIRRGFAAVKAAKDRSDEKRAEFNDRVDMQDLLLREDGQEEEVWLNGDPDLEPVVIPTHTLRLRKPLSSKPRIMNEVCSRDEGECVYCWAEENGDKRVSKAGDSTYVSVVQGKWVHKIKNEERTAATKDGKYERFDWFDCPDDATCKLCKKKVPRERIGQRKFRMTITAAAAFYGENESMKRRCLNCGGKIKVTGFTNGTKTLPDLDGVKHPEKWEPVQECRGCDDPKPGSVFSGPLTIRRNGTGLTTSYSFKGSVEPEGMPDWVLEYEPQDLEKVLKARGVETQAKILGVQNPFSEYANKGKKHSGAEPYDEEEDKPKETEDPFDND